MNICKRIAWLLPLLASLAAGCDLPGRPNPADSPVPADKVLEFSVLFRENCSGCHGADGKLGAAPPLNDAIFRAIVSEPELESTIIHGRKGTLMPAFAMENGGMLTEPQIQVLVKQIKGIPYKIVEKQKGGMATVVPDAGGISPMWGTPEKPPNNVPSYSASSTGPDGADEKKGAAVFARACAMCHGSHGQGVEHGNETVNTINDAVFLALISNQALRRYAITGRQDLGMPAYAAARPGSAEFVPLSDQEVTDLVALLASWRGTK